LCYHGRFREADEKMDLARTLDPTGTFTLLYLGLMRDWEERYSEAIGVARPLVDRYPDQLSPQIVLTQAYIGSGQCELALADLQKPAKRFPSLRALEAKALAECGRREEALRITQQFEAKYAANPRMPRFILALAWEAVGDQGRAMNWLERSADQHEFQILSIAVNPGLKKMRSEPAFRALVKRIGLE
jgi:tetratricopeptide (TPR) repeat protein